MMSATLRDVLFTEPADRKPLRLVPGIIIVAVQWILWLVIPALAPGMDTLALGMFGGLLGGIALIVWWAFFSRAAGVERLGAVLLMVFGLVVTAFIQDESMKAAQLGLTMFTYAIPILSLAFIVWAVATKKTNVVARRVSMATTILVACFAWAFVRNEGMTSDIGHDFAFRFASTPQQDARELLNQAPALPPAEATKMNPDADWPGFRGPTRDNIVPGISIATDWDASPPVELWRRPVGRGFSSFAVRGGLIYTQEQRGEKEVVTCYYLASGDPAWIHSDTARFLGADAHPGPRATPTVHDGRVYAFGATGILNALDARDGRVVWSRQTARDAKKELPTWGLASSPLIVDDMVIVHAADALLAYERAGGTPRWSGTVGSGYSSPHLLTIGGIRQVVLLSSTGASSFDPRDGTKLWEHPWPQDDRILQPTLAAEGDMLVPSVLKSLRRIGITSTPGGWTIEERWTSRALPSNFNDLVVLDGHAYGFSNSNLACIDLSDGSRAWKGRAYGGQLALLADQKLLLVLSQKGELALVDATPTKYVERARIKVLKGKTWNHPAFAGNTLLVRNAQEMAAYRLPVVTADAMAGR